ncbi:transport protein-like protein sec22 [Pseudovirgaria hyperparasitica]|uniref:Protein transport protein SEC22 n=1 Tax=Pseudovirgaria hyperparasitica TaxID=470096 RepID=A0A6A6VY22_9PEZI|nr:transport protein-like protein sec22 [Pseudovirgaria hyperparasitica]KAF2755558.1 transport protein-like protein sec22 [Pseudovirgaria hyperparasitica]
MVKSTLIVRVDHLGGSVLVETQNEMSRDPAMLEASARVKKVIRQAGPQSATHADIDCGKYTVFYVMSGQTMYVAFCEKSYPKNVAFTYLDDIQTQFSQQHPEREYAVPTVLKPFHYMSFENDIRKTMKAYSDPRAVQGPGLDKINEELRGVTEVMKKNIEDLIYRGDSLDKMGDMSSRLREESRKYRKAAVRINWELLLKQYGPIGGVALIMIIFIWWRFF